MKINKSKFYHSLFSNLYFAFIGILIIFALLTTGIAIATKGADKIMGLDWWIPVLIFDLIFIWSLVSLSLHYIIFKSPNLNIKKIKIISYFMLSFQNLYFLQRKQKMENEDIVVPKFLTPIYHLFPDDKIRIMFARIANFIYVIFWLIGGLYVLKLLTNNDLS
ncbi:MAG: hypothetical protein E7Y34_02365, partial [Mycoplasma sp.]|nr:hypothetical protein [Mycoplasma sp.]